MDTKLCLGLLIGMLAGAGWAYLFGLWGEVNRRKEDDSMRRHLQDLEADIERGQTP